MNNNCDIQCRLLKFKFLHTKLLFSAGPAIRNKHLNIREVCVGLCEASDLCTFTSNSASHLIFCTQSYNNSYYLTMGFELKKKMMTSHLTTLWLFLLYLQSLLTKTSRFPNPDLSDKTQRCDHSNEALAVYIVMVTV